MLSRNNMESLTKLYYNYLTNKYQRKNGLSDSGDLRAMARIYAEENGVGIDWQRQEEVLIDWVHSVVKGPLINILIAETINATDSWVLHNLEVFQKMLEELPQIQEGMNKTARDLKSYSRQDLLKDVKQVLIEIDSTGTLWRKFNLNFGKTILILNDIPGSMQDYFHSMFGLEEGASATYDSVLGPITLLSLTGTIDDLPKIIYEFMHFINIGQIKSTDLLSEYPSIMGEIFAVVYLKKKDYEPNQIKYLYLKRYRFIAAIRKILLQFISLSAIYIKNGIITPDDMLNIDLDELIRFLIIDKNVLNHIYPYIMGVWLAQKSIEQDNKIFTIRELTGLSWQIGVINLSQLIKRFDNNLGMLIDDSCFGKKVKI